MAAYRGSQLKSVLASLIAGLTMVTLPASAAASTPTLMWTGAKRLNLLCNVAGGPGIDQAAMSAQLCRSVQRLAIKRAPMPVRTILIGDPAVLASDAVTLLVHASVTRSGNDRLLAFSIRPFRSSNPDATVLFGAAPRAAPLTSPGASSPALDAALGAALGETLQWFAGPGGAHPPISHP